ncbi:Phox homologous domain [Pseudocohnilembus persalinus]|uniref:Phox homologous domain n=1 Tax=Pseudocohnilembus persalinus TaxID=266149 RepID=A0A0V0QXE1_PSEPJ|nr:Phox homologous domain [Pseudocohnilembus persalinus]|eukprot:KRX06907.1 Phox homologous domain [Pseudocohnilembus persalinus]
MDNNILNQVKVTESQIIVDQNKKKYCTYEVQVSTMHVDYTIYKRYSEFFELKKEVEKQNIKVDVFPDKKWFGVLNNSVIKIRRDQFNYQFEARNIGSYVRKRQPSIFDNDGKISYKPVNDQEKEYIKILQNLKNNPDELSIHFKNLRQFLFEQKPQLSSALIALSIRGDSDFPGLIEICGSYKQDREFSPHLTCSIGLDLLNDMMSFEQNITYHILSKSNTKCKVAALKLLKKYIEKQQNLEHSILKYIVIEDEVFQQLEEWIGLQILTNKYNNQNPYTNYKDDQKAKDDMLQDYKHSFLSFQNQQYNTPQKMKQQQQKQEIKKEQEYKFPDQSEDQEDLDCCYFDEKDASPNEDSAPKRAKKKMNAQLKKTVLVNQQKKPIQNVKDIENFIDDKSIQWESLYKYDNMKVKKTLQPDNILQISISLNISAVQAAEIFIDKREEWDKQLKEYKTLEVIDNNSQSIQMTNLWYKNTTIASLTQICHMEIRRTNNSCIYQYFTPVDRNVNLDPEQSLGKCMTLIQIKDRVQKGKQQQFKQH